MLDEPGRSPTDQLIGELTRGGAPDAEIGVRLGLPVSEVRRRREQVGIAARPVESPASGARAEHRRARMAAAIVVACSFAALAFAAWHWWADNGTTGSAGNERFVDIGKVVLTPSGESISAQHRDVLTVLSVPDGTLLQPYAPAGWSASWLNGLVLTGQIDGEWVQVRFEPQRVNLERLYGQEAWRVTRSAGGATPDGPAIVVRATGFSVGSPSRRLRVLPNGHLLVAAVPFGGDAVINSHTGESLNLFKATRVGLLGAGGASTYCDMQRGADHACWTAWRNDLYVAPGDGLFRCGEDGAIEFDADAPGLTIRLTSMPGGTTICDRQPKGSVLPAGSPLTKSTERLLRVQVVDASGLPLSTAMDSSGYVYAGVTATVGCPCVGGT